MGRMPLACVFRISLHFARVSLMIMFSRDSDWGALGPSGTALCPLWHISYHLNFPASANSLVLRSSEFDFMMAACSSESFLPERWQKRWCGFEETIFPVKSLRTYQIGHRSR